MEYIGRARKTMFERRVRTDDKSNEAGDSRKCRIADEERTDRKSEREREGEGDQRIPEPPKCAKALSPPMQPATYTKEKPRLESRLDCIKEMTTEGWTDKGKG